MKLIMSPSATSNPLPLSPSPTLLNHIQDVTFFYEIFEDGEQQELVCPPRSPLITDYLRIVMLLLLHLLWKSIIFHNLTSLIIEFAFYGAFRNKKQPQDNNVLWRMEKYRIMEKHWAFHCITQTILRKTKNLLTIKFSYYALYLEIIHGIYNIYFHKFYLQ